MRRKNRDLKTPAEQKEHIDNATCKHRFLHRRRIYKELRRPVKPKGHLDPLHLFQKHLLQNCRTVWLHFTFQTNEVTLANYFQLQSVEQWSERPVSQFNLDGVFFCLLLLLTDSDWLVQSFETVLFQRRMFLAMRGVAVRKREQDAVDVVLLSDWFFSV